jgi:hypothetical protein
MSLISAAVAKLDAAPHADTSATVVTKGTLQSELAACRERTAKLDALIEVSLKYCGWSLHL